MKQESQEPSTASCLTARLRAQTPPAIGLLPIGQLHCACDVTYAQTPPAPQCWAELSASGSESDNWPI